MRDFTEPNPVTAIEAIASSTSLAVYWTAPTGQKITAYQVQLKGVANTRKSVPDTSTTFDKLLPGTSYTVVVSPMSGSTLGDPAEGIFTTSILAYFFFCVMINYITHLIARTTKNNSHTRTHNKIHKCEERILYERYYIKHKCKRKEPESYI